MPDKILLDADANRKLRYGRDIVWEYTGFGLLRNADSRISLGRPANALAQQPPRYLICPCCGRQVAVHAQLTDRGGMAWREQSPDRVSQVSSWNPGGPASLRESTLDAAESRPAVSVGEKEDFIDAPKTSVSSISGAAGESLNSRPHTEHTVENAEQPPRPTDDEILAQENKIRYLEVPMPASKLCLSRSDSCLALSTCCHCNSGPISCQVLPPCSLPSPPSAIVLTSSALSASQTCPCFWVPEAAARAC